MNRYQDMSVYFDDLSLDHDIKAVKAEKEAEELRKIADIAHKKAEALRKISDIAHQKARPNRKRWSNV